MARVAMPELVKRKASGLHQIDRLILGYRGAKALMVGASLGLFTRLAEGPATAEALSAKLGTAARPTRVLLDALAALGFLSKRAGRYANAPLASDYLVEGTPGYLGDNLKYQEMAWRCWSDLGALTRDGRSGARIWELLAKSPEFAQAYIRGMDNIAAAPARAIAARLDLGEARALLDVGAGPGAYARALLERHPRLTAALFDLPASSAVAREVFRGSPLRSRVSFIEGDYLRDPLGRDEYDAVLLSHVTHNELEADVDSMIRRSHEALRSGGRLVIHDFTVDDDGAGPPFASLLSLHMLVTTGKGRVYSKAEYKAWMRRAGFRSVGAWPVPSELENPTWVIVGEKA